jgi:DNA-binding winged helix-turn-helix (wHTH) protein
MDNQFKLGPWLVNPTQCTIKNEHTSKTIEPKAMALLLTLAEADGELVTRSEIFESIWKDQVVTDYALNTLMANLRKSLNTGDEATQFIETRTKLGYRLTPEIEWLMSPTKKAHKEPFKKFRLAIAVALVLITTLFFSFKNFSFITADSNADNTQASKPQQSRYFSKVTDTVIKTDRLENGNPICINRVFDLVVHTYYLDQQWILSSDLYSVTLKHTGKSLLGVKEGYHFEFIGPVGTVSADAVVFFKYVDEYSSNVKWKVLNQENKIICEGTSTITGKKI